MCLGCLFTCETPCGQHKIGRYLDALANADGMAYCETSLSLSLALAFRLSSAIVVAHFLEFAFAPPRTNKRQGSQRKRGAMYGLQEAAAWRSRHASRARACARPENEAKPYVRVHVRPKTVVCLFGYPGILCVYRDKRQHAKCATYPRQAICILHPTLHRTRKSRQHSHGRPRDKPSGDCPMRVVTCGYEKHTRKKCLGMATNRPSLALAQMDGVWNVSCSASRSRFSSWLGGSLPPLNVRRRSEPMLPSGAALDP